MINNIKLYINKEIRQMLNQSMNHWRKRLKF